MLSKKGFRPIGWLVAYIKPALSSMIAIAGSIIGGSMVLQLSGIDPAFAYYTIFYEALATSFGITKMLVEMTPLLITAAGLLVCFRAGIWNIGAQGQMLIGTLFANIVGYSLGPLPTPIILPLVLISGALAGAAWALPPALLKAKLGINEVITTLLLNFVAINIVRFLIKGPLRNLSEEHPQTYPIAETAFMPTFPGTRLHVGIIIAFIIAAAIYFLMTWTKLGFQFKILGESIKTARYVGLPISSLIILVFIISGGAAGFAGAVQLTSVMRNVNPAWTPGYGLEAVPLVFIAKMSPIAVVPLTVLFTIFIVGTDIMHRTTGVPVFFIEIFLGIMLLLFAVSEVIQRLRVERAVMEWPEP